MAKKDEAKQALQHWASAFQPKKRFRTAYLGDGRGTARENLFVNENSPHPKERQLVWARYRLNTGDRFSVINRYVNPAFNLPVFIGEKDEEPGVDQVVGVDYGAIPTGGDQYALPPHAPTHELNGSDEIRLDSRQFMPGLVYPTTPPSLELKMLGFVYYYSEWKVVDQSDLPTMVSLRPATAGETVFVLIAIELETKDVEYFASDSYPLSQQTWDQFFDDSGLGGELEPLLPDLPAGYAPLALAVLESDTTQISWKASINNLFDYRQHISINSNSALAEIAGASRVGEIMFSVNGETLSPYLPVTNSSGLIVTNDDGLIVVV
jgi:hypothetical protein